MIPYRHAHEKSSLKKHPFLFMSIVSIAVITLQSLREESGYLSLIEEKKSISQVTFDATKLEKKPKLRSRQWEQNNVPLDGDAFESSSIDTQDMQAEFQLEEFDATLLQGDDWGDPDDDDDPANVVVSTDNNTEDKEDSSEDDSSSNDTIDSKSDIHMDGNMLVPGSKGIISKMDIRRDDNADLSNLLIPGSKEIRNKIDGRMDDNSADSSDDASSKEGSTNTRNNSNDKKSSAASQSSDEQVESVEDEDTSDDQQESGDDSDGKKAGVEGMEEEEREEDISSDTTEEAGTEEKHSGSQKEGAVSFSYGKEDENAIEGNDSEENDTSSNETVIISNSKTSSNISFFDSQDKPQNSKSHDEVATTANHSQNSPCIIQGQTSLDWLKGAESKQLIQTIKACKDNGNGIVEIRVNDDASIPFMFFPYADKVTVNSKVILSQNASSKVSVRIPLADRGWDMYTIYKGDRPMFVLSSDCNCWVKKEAGPLDIPSSNISPFTNNDEASNSISNGTESTLAQSETAQVDDTSNRNQSGDANDKDEAKKESADDQENNLDEDKQNEEENKEGETKKVDMDKEALAEGQGGNNEEGGEENKGKGEKEEDEEREKNEEVKKESAEDQENNLDEDKQNEEENKEGETEKVDMDKETLAEGPGKEEEDKERENKEEVESKEEKEGKGGETKDDRDKGEGERDVKDDKVDKDEEAREEGESKEEKKDETAETNKGKDKTEAEVGQDAEGDKSKNDKENEVKTSDHDGEQKKEGKDKDKDKDKEAKVDKDDGKEAVNEEDKAKVETGGEKKNNDDNNGGETSKGTNKEAKAEEVEAAEKEGEEDNRDKTKDKGTKKKEDVFEVEQPKKTPYRFLFGIFSEDNEKEHNLRDNHRSTYLSYYKDWYDTKAGTSSDTVKYPQQRNAICSLHELETSPALAQDPRACRIVYTFVFGGGDQNAPFICYWGDDNKCGGLSSNNFVVTNPEYKFSAQEENSRYQDMTFLSVAEGHSKGKLHSWFSYATALTVDRPELGINFVGKLESTAILWPSKLMMNADNENNGSFNQTHVYGGRMTPKKKCSKEKPAEVCKDKLFKAPFFGSAGFVFLSTALAQHVFLNGTTLKEKRSRFIPNHEDMSLGNLVYVDPKITVTNMNFQTTAKYPVKPKNFQSEYWKWSGLDRTAVLEKRAKEA